MPKINESPICMWNRFNTQQKYCFLNNKDYCLLKDLMMNPYNKCETLNVFWNGSSFIHDFCLKTNRKSMGGEQ